MYRMLMIAVLFGFVTLFHSSFAQTENNSDYSHWMDLYNSATTRDDQVEYLKKAILARPEHPDNIVLDYEIANNLSSNTLGGQPTKPLEALKYYERVLDNYNYDDYYQFMYKDSENWKELKQNVIVQSAIQVSAISAFEIGNKEKAQKFAYESLELLSNTFTRRTNDWLTEPQPKPPNNVQEEPGGVVAFKRGMSKQRIYEAKLNSWNSRKKLAKAGNVFGEAELSNAKIAVKYYGLSYGRQRPEMVPIAMNKIIEDFPNTPMAEIAQQHINIARKIIIQQDVDEVIAEVNDYLDQDIMLNNKAEIEIATDVTPMNSESETVNTVEKSSEPNGSKNWWPFIGIAIILLLSGGGATLMKKKQ